MLLSLPSAPARKPFKSREKVRSSSHIAVPRNPRRSAGERPVSVAAGTNQLIDHSDAAASAGAWDGVRLPQVGEALAAPMPAVGRRPELWDDHAARRLVAVIAGCATYRLPPDGT